MRDILFRGRHFYTKEWVYGDLVHFYFSRTAIQFSENGMRKTVFVIPETVGQYTGLKDKNMVAYIFEGDIISPMGFIKGDIHDETTLVEREVDLVISGFGTKNWEATNKKAMELGLKYSE